MAAATDTAKASSEPIPIYGTMFMVAEGAMAEAFVNGLPLSARSVRGPRSQSKHYNERLLQGKNQLELHIHRAPNKDDHEVSFEVYRLASAAERLAAAGAEVEPHTLIERVYPAIVDELQQDDSTPRRLAPLCYRTTFHISATLNEHECFSATPQSFDEEGTPALRSAVHATHNAVLANDVDELIRLRAFKHRNLERCYRGHANYAAAAANASVRRFFSEPFEVDPFDPGLLHYEPLLDGRVARIRRLDDAPIYGAYRKSDPKHYFATHVALFAHVDGEWKLF